MSPLRTSMPCLHSLRRSTLTFTYTAGRPTSHAFHTSTSLKSSSPLFHLAALSNSRESSHFRKVSKLSQVEHSPALQLIRSSEVEPFGAPKSIKSDEERKRVLQKETPSATNKGVMPLRSQQEWSDAELAKMKEMTRGGMQLSNRPEEWSGAELAKIKELSAGEKVVLRELLKRDARFASREAMMNEQANGLGKVASQEIGRIAEVFFPTTQHGAPAGQTRADLAEDAQANEEAEEAAQEPWKEFGISEAEYMALQTLEEGGGSRDRKAKERTPRASTRSATSTNPMETPDEKLWGPEATPRSPAVSDGEWMASVMQFKNPPNEDSQANVRNAYPGQPLFSTNGSREQAEKAGSNTTRWVIASSILTGLLVWNVRPGESSVSNANVSAVQVPKAAKIAVIDQDEAQAKEVASRLAEYKKQSRLAEEEEKRLVKGTQAAASQDKIMIEKKSQAVKKTGSSGWFWE